MLLVGRGRSIGRLTTWSIDRLRTGCRVRRPGGRREGVAHRSNRRGRRRRGRGRGGRERSRVGHTRRTRTRHRRKHHRGVLSPIRTDDLWRRRSHQTGRFRRTERRPRGIKLGRRRSEGVCVVCDRKSRPESGRSMWKRVRKDDRNGIRRRRRRRSRPRRNNSYRL